MKNLAESLINESVENVYTVEFVNCQEDGKPFTVTVSVDVKSSKEFEDFLNAELNNTVISAQGIKGSKLKL